ncbi:hypothetical protein M1N64_00800 [Peptococcaceae bacterium]|nr:hypothetical protein [Peptococcaceae bacterium]
MLQKFSSKILAAFMVLTLLMPVILAPVTAVQAMEKIKIDTSCELELLLEQDIGELVDYENIGKDQIEGSGDVEVQYANLIIAILREIVKHGKKVGPVARQVWSHTKQWVNYAQKQAEKYKLVGPGGTRIFQVHKRKDKDNIVFRLDYGDIAHTGTKFFHYHRGKGETNDFHYIIWPEPTAAELAKMNKRGNIAAYVGFNNIPQP